MAATLQRSISTAFILAGRTGGFLDSSKYRKGVLHKLAKDLELPSWLSR